MKKGYLTQNIALSCSFWFYEPAICGRLQKGQSQLYHAPTSYNIFNGNRFQRCPKMLTKTLNLLKPYIHNKIFNISILRNNSDCTLGNMHYYHYVT